MKRKGFTLTELLATIVVIAVISLITVPVVTNVIEKSQKGTFLRSAEGVRKISSNYYIQNSAVFSSIDELEFTCDNEKCYSSDALEIITNKDLGVEEAMGNGYVKIYDNGNIEFLLSNGKYCAEKNPSKEEVKVYNNGTCEGIIIDNDKVKINNISTISTTKSILVKVEASAGKSGIGKYVFAIDGEVKAEIKSTDTSYEYLFDDLSGKNHKITVRVYNGTYDKPNYDKSMGMDEKEIDANLLDFGNIKITSSTTDWSTSKTYAISGTTKGATLQYKIVSGTTIKQDWTNYDNSITVDWQSTVNAPTYIYARFNDGRNTSDEVTYTETKIDTTAPSVPTIIKGVYADWTVIDDLTKWHNKTVYFPQTGKNGEILVSGAIDNESGIARYEISSDNKTWYDLSKYNATGAYNTAISAKRYYRAINSVGLASSSTEVDIKIDTTNPTVSYSLARGTYNAYQTVRVTVTDDNFQSMSVLVFKNKALVYEGKVDSKSIDNTTNNTFDVALDSNGVWTIYTRATDLAFNEIINTPNNGEWYYQTYTIDTTAPTVTLTKGTVTTKSITVVANAKDDETGIKGYQFSIDNGSTWKPMQTSNTYTFDNLKTGTYNIKVKVYNNVNLNATSSTLSVSTLAFDKPTFTVSPSGWVSSKKVTITYPQAATIKQYSLDGGKTYTSYNGALTFTSSQSIVAKASDGTNTTTNTENVLIDTTTPVATITVFNGSGVQVSNGGKIGLNSTSTIRFNCSTGVSGVANYKYNSIHKVTYTPTIESKIINSTSKTYDYKIIPKNLKNSLGTMVKTGTIHHELTCTNGAGKISSVATFDTVLVDDSISLTLKQTNKTVSSITATATASSAVGIAKYEFKIDSGSWVNNGTSNVYTFRGLAEYSTHTIYTRVTNNTGVGAKANISAVTSKSSSSGGSSSGGSSGGSSSGGSSGSRPGCGGTVSSNYPRCASSCEASRDVCVANADNTYSNCVNGCKGKTECEAGCSAGKSATVAGCSEGLSNCYKGCC